MAFINRTNSPYSAAAVPSDKPPVSALQMILYLVASLILLALVPFWAGSALDNNIAAGPRIAASAGAVFCSLVLYGFGQVVGYLSAAAHYTRLTYELQKKRSQS